MPSSAPTQVRAVAEHAVRSGQSLSKAAFDLATGSEDPRLLGRRAEKYVRRHVLGQEALDLFFKRGASVDLMLASRLVCDPGEITDLVSQGGIPVADACRGLPGEKKVYQILYNRIGRAKGDAVRGLRKRKSRKPSNFFTVSGDELGSLGR